MNVNELRHLSQWFTDDYSRLSSLYSGVLSPIQHNASQQSKQPVEEQLEVLLKFLRRMTFDELSVQQLETLSALGVDKHLGLEGARFVEALIRTAEYDPSTASTKIQEAMQKLSEVNSHFTAYLNATESLGFGRKEQLVDLNAITIRVGFRNDASIEHLKDWKDSAKDWYDIVRGVAMAAGEAPENTKVIGASTGSIILILAATATVTGLLALISKHVASVAKDVVSISSQIEVLRSKKFLNELVETELKKLQQEKKDKAQNEIVAAIKEKILNLDGGQVTALEASVKKLLTFNEKGGNVDFVAPEADNEEPDESGEANAERDALIEVRAMIRDYQSTREELKLLEDQSKNV